MGALILNPPQLKEKYMAIPKEGLPPEIDTIDLAVLDNKERLKILCLLNTLCSENNHMLDTIRYLRTYKKKIEFWTALSVAVNIFILMALLSCVNFQITLPN
jgi:hypothetical protein